MHTPNDYRVSRHAFIPIVYTDNDFRQFSLSC